MYLAQLRGQLDLGDASAVDRYRQQVLDAMIESKILLLRARAEGIRTTREEVDEAVAGMVGEIRGRFPSEQDFLEQLEREGTDVSELEASFRPRLEEQLLVRKVMERHVRSQVFVDEREVRRYWEEHQDEIPAIPATLQLRRILVKFATEAVVDSVAQERAAIVRERLEAGEDFASLAETFSEGPAASRGGELGWFTPRDLDAVLAEAVEGLPAGAISDVVITKRGAHILKVDERKEGELKLSQIIFLRDEEAARAAARARAEALHRRLDLGESFEALARSESDDEATRDQGGALGDVAIESLGPAYRPALETLGPGEISDVLEDEEGYSIFRVDSKEGERTPSYEEIRDRIAMVLEQEKAQEIYVEYLERAREETFVDVRLHSES